MGSNWYIWFFGLVISLFGLYIGGLGVMGLIQKRPLITLAKNLMWVMLLAFLPNLINSFRLFGLSSSFRRLDLFTIGMPIINIILYAVLIFVFWRQMSGYMIYGIYDETFHEALVAALNKLNLPFQETVSKIRLTSLNADLHVAVASWMGTAQLRIKQSEHRKIADQIANEMKVYFISHQVKVNNISFIVNLILGILMFALLAIMVPLLLH